MKAPVQYTPGFIPEDIDIYIFKALRNELNWIRHDNVPRREYYYNSRYPELYSYGRGFGLRTYQPQEAHWAISLLHERLRLHTGFDFEVCFLNGYEDASDHLGWHADDSPEMDDDRPIAIISLGGEREIWFREKQLPETETNIVKGRITTPVSPEKLLLQSGSLCLMLPGMQETHQHRIPKCDRIVGPRISLTFRGYVK